MSADDDRLGDLAARLTEARAERARVWDEGYAACAEDAGGDQWWAASPNPYRAALADPSGGEQL